MDDTREKINDIIVDLFNNIMRLEQTSLESTKFDLTINEIHVLEAISKVELSTMSHVAKKTGVTIGTLTTSINRLVKKGYVERTYDEHDRRKVILKNTKNAAKIVRLHNLFHEQMVNSMLKNFEDDEVKVLYKMLDQLQIYFDEVDS